jgi:hypothetical protein
MKKTVYQTGNINRRQETSNQMKLAAPGRQHCASGSGPTPAWTKYIDSRLRQFGSR